MMNHLLVSLCLLGSVLATLSQCTVPASEFQLEGNYVVGGLFNIHQASGSVSHVRPEVTECSRKPFLPASYRRFQVMRFAVEEINNSTDLLPNVSLGYEIYDDCSDTQNFPGILKLISVNEVIQPWIQPHNLSKVIALVGAYSSTQTQTVFPFFQMNLIPMISYAATSSIFSVKERFPTFLRTVHPNADVIEVIVNILRYFNWRWVALLNVDDEYGNDLQALFIKRIKDTEICLAYTKGLSHNTDYSTVFKQIKAQNINTIIVFANELIAEAVIEAAIQQNVTNKVWIADEGWSLNKRLPKEQGIRNIGTVLGITEFAVPIPGFNDFIFASKSQNHSDNVEPQMFCSQICNCSDLSAKEIIEEDPAFSFTVYSAVYAIAHALHKVLQCGPEGCKDGLAVYPHEVLYQLQKLTFTLLNQTIQFDENGDPMFGSYSVVFWNRSGEAEEVGFCHYDPSFQFFINSSKIQWHTEGKVPSSVCSEECREGYQKIHNGIHKCCFDCKICDIGTYVNSTEDPYNCIRCKETEWSAEGSTSCRLREVVYVPFTDTGAILVMVGALVFVALTLAMSVLFAINYNTPVVRSAGGPMCFLILGCLSLSSLSVFFYFGKPTVPFCILRFLPFLLFYTVCLACFAVRSFQIFCIFKTAAKFPVFHRWWMKYHGQWLIITLVAVAQSGLLMSSYSFHPPKPLKNTIWYQDRTILSCDLNLEAASGSLVLLLLSCFLCFIFSYMIKTFPNNYNEAKSITFCLLLLILTWIIFTTVFILYRGKYINILNALAVLSSLYSFLLFYFLPKCYIIIFKPHKNTQQYFQGLINSYTRTIGQ